MLIDNLLHHCTIVNRDFVIRLNVVNEGGSESDRLGWHSRTRTRTRDGGRKWVWTTRLAFANENEGRGRKWVWTTHWIIHRKHDWTNERTNERTNELSLANWTTRTDSRRIMKSITTGNKSYFKEKVYLTLLLMLFFSWMLFVFGTKSTVAQINTSSAFFQFVI